MRALWLSTLLFFLARSVFTQTFFPSPDPVLEQEVQPEQANECYIFFENASGDTLQLRWKAIETNFPEQWDIDLCDFGACYVGIPATGLMNPAVGAEQPYLKLIVQPGNTPGVAWLWFRVAEAGEPNHFADVFFSLHTPGVTAAGEAPLPLVRLFPNPASGPVWLKNLQDLTVQVRLLSVGGQYFWSGTLLPLQQHALDLSAWPAGTYYMLAAGKTYPVIRIP